MIRIIDIKKFVAFTIILEPVIILVYLPYYMLVIKYTSWQLVRWILTTIPFTLAIGVLINPFEMFLVRWIDKKVR